MRVVFDNNGFAVLSQQAQFGHCLKKLKELTEASRIEVVDSCTLLQELAGLANSNPALYLKTIADYKQLTNRVILKHAHHLAIQEGESCKPVHFEDSLLGKTEVENLFDNLNDPLTAQSLFGETASLKGGYAQTMEQARNGILSHPSVAGKSPKDIASGYQDWFQHFDEYVQNWFMDLFGARGQCDVKSLPHVYAFLGYALTRVYERFTLNKKDRDNDLFDRAYFTDAAVADILVTNDSSFTRTALRVPNRMCEVLKIDELIKLIDKWHGT